VLGKRRLAHNDPAVPDANSETGDANDVPPADYDAGPGHAGAVALPGHAGLPVPGTRNADACADCSAGTDRRAIAYGDPGADRRAFTHRTPGNYADANADRDTRALSDTVPLPVKKL
jgi:hypothetical protein